MKIAVAQIMPQKGNILKNIEKHKAFISLAASGQASAIFFPELAYDQSGSGDWFYTLILRINWIRLHNNAS